QDHLALSNCEDQPNKDSKLRGSIYLGLKILAFLAFHGYLIAGVYLTWDEAKSYCHDVKFLVVVTAIVYICLIWKLAAYGFVYFFEASWDNAKGNLKESISPGTRRTL
ncbi:unnamed protein product, partial [Ixodes hexagonus]